MNSHIVCSDMYVMYTSSTHLHSHVRVIQKKQDKVLEAHVRPLCGTSCTDQQYNSMIIMCHLIALIISVIYLIKNSNVCVFTVAPSAW